MNKIISLISIPAYNVTGKGLAIPVKIICSQNHNYSVKGIGSVAISLLPNFHRIIEIMSSINNSWYYLYSLDYILESDITQIIVKDSKSSSMAISIGLINLHRAIKGKHQISELTGTGILRLDGSFQSSNNENEKSKAVSKATGKSGNFITSAMCNHLLDLESTMDNFTNKEQLTYAI